MFERLLQFLLSAVMVASLGLHGVVHAAAPGASVGTAWQQRLYAPVDDSGSILTGAGFDCSSRKQICHGDWWGLAEGGASCIVHAACPPLVKSVIQASSWLPGVLQKPPRI